MSYQGNKPATSFESPKKDRFTGISGTTCSLTYPVSSVADILVWVNGVKQDFTNYSVSGSTLTLGGTLVSADIVEVTYVGRTYGSIAPSDASIVTSSLQDDAVTTAKINDGAVTSGKIASGVVPSLRPNANPLIINGDMQVAQRGTSTSGITGSNNFVVDRFRFDEGADATLTMSQETLTSGNAFDNGFKKSLKLLVTTADGSLASNQSEQLMQSIEAQNLQLLKFGTSNAVNLTLAFWYKSNVTGTHVVTLDKEDSTRTTCPVEFTVSSANTWEHKVLNFNADATIKASTGAITNDNGTGLRVMWNLAYGSDYTSGTNGDWTQGGVGHFSTSNQQNIGGSNNNYVEVTGVQLEVGQFTSSTLPPFQHEDFGNNLARCQRYYYLHAEGNGKSLGSGGYYNTQQAEFTLFTPVLMRTNPTLEIATGTDYYVIYRDNGSDTVNSFALNTESKKEAIRMNNNAQATVDSAGVAGHFVTNNNSAKLALTAEL